jgi:hypothetical protein
MAVYGIDFYGVGRFGVDPATVRPDFSVAPFTSTPLDYSTLHLTWSNPPSTDCAYLRLVRNPANLPQDEDDGVQVFDVSVFADTVPEAPSSVFGDPNDAVVTGSITQLTDMYLSQGFVYYSMFGWSTSEGIWIRCTDLVAMVPINWGYGYHLYSLLPMAYRDADIVLVDPYNPWPVDGAQPPLQRYLQLIGFQFDFLRTELESLMSINDAQNCSGALLPVMMQQFGLVHEPEMGMQQERQLVQNAIHLYKYKGSPRGITEFTSILTSYPATTLVHHGYNELLCLDDGVMADAIGTWQNWPPAGTNFPTITGTALGMTFTQIPSLPAAGTTNPLTTYPSDFPTLSPAYNNTGLSIHATGAGDLYATTAGIPITDFMSQNWGAGAITFTIQLWSSVARQVYLSLWGDVGDGVPFQIVAPTLFTETAGQWTLMTLTAPEGTVNPYPGPPAASGQGGIGPTVPTGPANYYWIYPRVRIVGAAANEYHYMTLCALWPCLERQVGIDTPVYDYPRDIKILLQPTQSNLLSNTLTMFNRPNPSGGPPTELLIGFDGLCTAADPLAKAGTTCNLVYRPASLEDPPELQPVNGNAALEVDTTGPGATVWFGTVTNWSAPPPTPLGWFATTGQWFNGAIEGTNPRPWFDPTYSWFVTNQFWFGVGSAWVNGLWFSQPAQPPMNCNLLPFQVNAGQPFNFSVYAQYITVQDPSNAVMQLGFRWYYPDGTWVEVTDTQQITDQYVQYSIAPSGGPFSLGDPPAEAITGILPTTVFPFVRFTSAQLARFLLNSAMLSPTESLQPYMDASSESSASGDYVPDPVSNASYIYPRRTPRVARLTAEMYRWVPMGSTYTITYAAGAVTPPLDPTLWP